MPRLCYSGLEFIFQGHLDLGQLWFIPVLFGHSELIMPEFVHIFPETTIISQELGHIEIQYVSFLHPLGLMGDKTEMFQSFTN